MDQTGSMAASVVNPGVFGAVLASIAWVRTRMVVFDTAASAPPRYVRGFTRVSCRIRCCRSCVPHSREGVNNCLTQSKTSSSKTTSAGWKGCPSSSSSWPSTRQSSFVCAWQHLLFTRIAGRQQDRRSWPAAPEYNKQGATLPPRQPSLRQESAGLLGGRHKAGPS